VYTTHRASTLAISDKRLTALPPQSLPVLNATTHRGMARLLAWVAGYTPRWIVTRLSTKPGSHSNLMDVHNAFTIKPNCHHCTSSQLTSCTMTWLLLAFTMEIYLDYTLYWRRSIRILTCTLLLLHHNVPGHGNRYQLKSCVWFPISS